ncbi:hypothetical protein AV521_25745 [Streptomyces sp. IMTB 2501]|uniref:hypothetical protein n=1 Tax=Streptomyces sp. IMTB 2501 TaxID=1776340 RepID=UPI00096C4DF4|nr:hypothetical protein AV521_25745 [Streptomyces sp. IMTB 2501]
MRAGTLTGGRAGGDAVTGGRACAEVVRAVNGLARRWAAAAHGGTVFPAAGVWPLPAFLADGATGPARAEPSEALGLPADQAARAARELLGAPAAAVAMSGAVGVGAPPQPRYVTTRIDAAFDRPFGFLAPHRHSRLVPAAGWVTDPLPYPADPYVVTGKAAQEDDE